MIIGRTVLLEEGLNGVLLWTGGVVIFRHNFVWLEMKAFGPFWVAGNVICPLKDLRLARWEYTGWPGFSRSTQNSRTLACL
jgi:hypothetical protein